jgi:lipoate-protein ligase B
MTPGAYSRFGWHLELGRVEYARALEWQRGLVRMRAGGFARDTIITLEHPPVITVGKDVNPDNFQSCGIEPFFIERGGDVTYHGPGQLVAYFIFNLTRRGRDLHKFMDDIQEGVIRALADLGIEAARGEENTGVWVGKKKLASIGVAVKKWVSFHGTAINLNTDLKQFGKINPCGLDWKIMTSAGEILGKEIDMAAFTRSLVGHYEDVFDTAFSEVGLEDLAEDVESQSGGYEI